MSFSGAEATGGSEEHRLHPVAMLLAALGVVRRWSGVAALPGVAALINGEFGLRVLLLVLLGVVLLGVLSAFWGVLSWRAAAYCPSGGAVPPQRGGLQKRTGAGRGGAGGRTWGGASALKKKN